MKPTHIVLLVYEKCAPVCVCVCVCVFVREIECVWVLGESRFTVANDCLPMSLIKDLYI